MHLDEMLHKHLSRRTVLKVGAAGAVAGQMALMEQLAWMPQRMAFAAGSLPDIQFDIGNFIAPAFTVNGVMVRFGPVFTLFVPAKLLRNPNRFDQALLANALNEVEETLPFSPSGIFTFVSYGIPYFNRLPGGLKGSLVASRIPRLASNNSRLALEEAVPSPTDVVPGNGITKKTFNVPVRIESNDMLFTLRSDSLNNINGTLDFLQFALPFVDFQTPRLMFQQIGITRKVADSANLPFAGRINPQSPMWMGFADQQTNAAGPSQIVTFVGNSSAKLTNANAGDYFDNGSIQTLSHDIQDLAQFYETPQQDPAGVGETFKERVQYMFRSNERTSQDGLPADGNADQFTDGGGPSFLANNFQGTGDALANINVNGAVFNPATGVGTFGGEHRMGHIAALQRSSRAHDGTPIHIRMDGAGFDSMDVPDGSNQPKLEFTAFIPTADFFNTMRANTAALDIISATGNLVADEDNGLERFITATRRQHFLCPPRRHRAYPLVELT
jgi:hypothetical protein